MILHCIMLTLNRYDVLKRCTDLNLQRAGVALKLHIVDNGSSDERVHHYIRQIAWDYVVNDDNQGVARMQNLALNHVDTYSRKDFSDNVFVCLLGNDIIMPPNWAADLINLHKSMQAHGKVGLVGIDCLGHAAACKPHPQYASALITHNVFGSCLFNIRLLWEVGYLCNAFHPYGLEDSDWHSRIAHAGFTNYYLAGATSEHIGHDVGQDNHYRKVKDESLQNNAQQWENQQAYYQYAKERGAPEWWYLRYHNSGYTIPHRLWRYGAWMEAPPGGG